MDENKRDPKNMIWIFLIVVVICTTGIICVALIVFGTPIASKLSDKLIKTDQTDGLVVNFEGTFDGADGEEGRPVNLSTLSFVSGYRGEGILFDNQAGLHFLTANNISADQGAIEFWLKPLWNGNDNQTYVFFEIGDNWYNRFRITKDGANNFRFMVWGSDTEYDAACNVSAWEANDWHHVKVNWNNNQISLYLDNILCDTQANVTMPDSLSPQFYIGSSAQIDFQAHAVLDEFIIYPQP
jgi:hypothetical protein